MYTVYKEQGEDGSGIRGGHQVVKATCGVNKNSAYYLLIPPVEASTVWRLWDEEEEGGGFDMTEHDVDYVYLRCQNNEGEMANHVNLLYKKPWLEDQNSQEQQQGDIEEEAAENTSSFPYETPLADSVVVILLDAVSRGSFKQSFPQTNAFLTGLGRGYGTVPPSRSDSDNRNEEEEEEGEGGGDGRGLALCFYAEDLSVGAELTSE